MRPTGITRYQWYRFNIFFLIEHFLGYSNSEKLIGNNRKALYREIDAQLKNSVRGELLPMPIGNADITLDQFRESYIKPVLPVVFKNAASRWPCSQKWSFDFFKNNYGEREVSLNDNVGLVDRKNPQQFETMTFTSYIDELQRGSLKYLKFSRVMDDDSTLKNDFNLGWLRKFHLPTSFGEQFLMFMGGKNTITPIHCGFSHTLFVQITGKKKWILWAPNERIFFDPRAERRSYFHTNADPYNLDDPNFPLIKYIKRYEVVLEPGDVLWFPSLLWHQVENLTDSISVAYKFADIPTAFHSSKILAPLYFLATKPNLFLTVLVNRFKKRDYIFTKRKEELG